MKTLQKDTVVQGWMAKLVKGKHSDLTPTMRVIFWAKTLCVSHGSPEILNCGKAIV